MILGTFSGLLPWIILRRSIFFSLFSSANWLLPMPICLVGCLFLIDFRSEIHTYTYMYTHIYTYIHMYIQYTYIYIHMHVYICLCLGFSSGTSGKEYACQCRRYEGCGFSPWVGKILWRRKWQLQHPCLENSTDGGAWWATVPGVAELDMAEATEHTQHVSVYVGNSDYILKVAQLCPTLRPHGLSSPWDSPGQNTGVGSLSLLQGVCPNQGSSPGPPHCRRILYQLSHQGSHINQYIYYIYIKYFFRNRAKPK